MTQTRTLAIDIGGSGIKAALLDDDGTLIGDRQRVPTPPKPVAPEALVQAIDKAVAPLGDFERVSVGFPGYIRDGRVLTAPNLGSEVLAGFDLQSELARHWGKPVRVLNDADVQGFGAIEGHGVEMVLTLGTGAGTAIFRDGEIMTHLELAHHPVSGGQDLRRIHRQCRPREERQEGLEQAGREGDRHSPRGRAVRSPLSRRRECQGHNLSAAAGRHDRPQYRRSDWRYQALARALGTAAIELPSGAPDQTSATST